MKNQIQKIIPIKNILNKGIIELKNNNYIKIIEIKPINYILKSDLEKEVILNNYKLFFKTCNFDIQIIIQSKKEDLSQNINYLNSIDNKNPKIKEIKNKYISYINNLSLEKISNSKVFYIVVSEKNEEEEKTIKILNEKYIKIKETLKKRGNICIEIVDRKEIIKIINSFINKKYIEKEEEE